MINSSSEAITVSTKTGSSVRARSNLNLALREVDCLLTQTQPVNLLARLCQTLQDDSGLSENGHIVCFSNPQGRGAAGRLAFETACVAATQLGLRVLFVDASTGYGKDRDCLAKSVKTAMSADSVGRDALADLMVTVSGTHLSYMLLGKIGQGGMSLIDLEAFDQLLGTLRPAFDLIIMDAPPVLDGPFGIALMKLADDAILVLEAEQTRAPVAAHAKETIEAAGIHLLGAVLHNRRFYIPKWVYRWL